MARGKEELIATLENSELLKNNEEYPQLKDSIEVMNNTFNDIVQKSGVGREKPSFEAWHAIAGLSSNKPFQKELKENDIQVVNEDFIKKSKKNIDTLIKDLESRKKNNKYKDKNGEKDLKEYLGSDEVRKDLAKVLGVVEIPKPGENLDITVNQFLESLNEYRGSLKTLGYNLSSFEKSIKKKTDKEARIALYNGASALIRDNVEDIDKAGQVEIDRQKQQEEKRLQEEERVKEKKRIKKEEYASIVGEGLFGPRGAELIEGIFKVTQGGIGNIVSGAIEVIGANPLVLVDAINEYAKLSGYKLLDFNRLTQLGDEEKRNQFIKEMLLMSADLFSNPALKDEFTSEQGVKNVALILQNVLTLVEKLENEENKKKGKEEVDFTPIKATIAILDLPEVIDLVNEPGMLPVLLKAFANEFEYINSFVKENIKGNKQGLKENPMPILIPLIRHYVSDESSLSAEELSAIFGLIAKRSEMIGSSVSAVITNIPAVKDAGIDVKYSKEIGSMSSKIVSNVMNSLEKQDLYGGVNFLLDVYEMLAVHGRFDKAVFEKVLSDDKSRVTFTNIIMSIGEGIKSFSGEEKEAVVRIIQSFIPQEYMKSTLSPEASKFLFDLSNIFVFEGVVNSLTDEAMPENKREFMMQLFNVIQAAENNRIAQQNMKEGIPPLFPMIDLTKEVRKLVSIGIVDTFGGPMVDALAKAFQEHRETSPQILKELFETLVLPNVKGAHRLNIDYETVARVMEDPAHLKNLMQALEELSNGEPGKAMKTLMSDMSLIGTALRTAFSYVIALLYEFFLGTFKNFMVKVETKTLGGVLVEKIPGSKFVEALTSGKDPSEYFVPLINYLEEGLPRLKTLLMTGDFRGLDVNFPLYGVSLKEIDFENAKIQSLNGGSFKNCNFNGAKIQVSEKIEVLSLGGKCNFEKTNFVVPTKEDGKKVIEVHLLNISPESFTSLLKDLNTKGIELKVDNLVITDVNREVNMQEMQREISVEGKVDYNQGIIAMFIEQMTKIETGMAK